MAHECQVPAASGGTRKWRCPECKALWRFNPNRTMNSLLWGRDGTRMPDGSKPKPWLSW